MRELGFKGQNESHREPRNGSGLVPSAGANFSFLGGAGGFTGFLERFDRSWASF